uniref:Cadherin domain-containing protein n=1 Tax=Erpetoichthys calabaricus TaxID=27687 RepID=A0A8C4SHC3_ERPCA
SATSGLIYCHIRIVLFSTFHLYFWKFAFAHLRYSVLEESIPGTIIGNVIKDLGLDIKNLHGRGLRVISGSKQQLLQVNHKTGALFVNEIIDREALCDKDKACLISIKIAIENPLEMHQVEIEIIDINDNSPAFQEKKKTLDISELTPAGSRFTLQGAYDPDSGVNSLKLYRLNQNDYFNLDVEERSKKNKIPVLVLQKPFDREEKERHDFLLTAYDGGDPPRSGDLNITVIVGDVNDNVPVFDKQVYSVTLEENVAVGTLVLKVDASDLDEGSNGDIIYSFENSIPDEVSEIFQLDMHTGQITVNGAIDFEEKELYELDVKATDRGQVPMSSICTVLIKIIDKNDNAPLIEVTSFSSSVFEDAKPGTVVGLISITDLDSGANSKLTCQSSDHMPFELKPSHQQNLYSLITNSRLDRESESQYNITITAKDFGQPSLTSYKTVLVNVLDVNDNSPKFLQDPYVFYIEENNTPGTSILAVSAVDADTNENALITYALDKNEAVEKPVVPFLSINSDNGQVICFTSFDFEELKSFTFSVVAKDSGVPPLSTTITVTVFILDQNDNPPVIVFPFTTNGTAVVEETVPRNVKAGYLVTRIRAYDADVGYNACPPGSTIITVSSTDPDLGENGQVTYALMEETSQGVPVSTLVSVNSATGDIRSVQSFDYEQVKTFHFNVIAKDGGSPSLNGNVTVHVYILDVNDNAPVMLPSFANGGEHRSESIPYSAEAGYLVNRIRAYDADAGYNALLSHYIIEDSVTGLFGINRNTGEIRTKRLLREEDSKQQELVIEVKDNGEPALSTTTTLTVLVVDTASEPLSDFRQPSRKEDNFSSFNLYLLISIVVVSVIFLTTLFAFILIKCHKRDDSYHSYGTHIVSSYPDGTLVNLQKQRYDTCLTADRGSDILLFNTVPNGELVINGTGSF